jgi:dienelactone hydrolase
VPVRALLRAVYAGEGRTPYDVITLKVYYPATPTPDAAALESGIWPVVPGDAPLPVAILLPGVNCESSMYAWLAAAIAQEGFIVAVISWVAQNLAGRVSLTPGLRLEALKPETYGHEMSCSSLPAVLAELSALQREGLLAGRLDMARIVLMGHSAGGTMALMNASARFVPGLAAAVSCMSNVLATSALGGWQGGALPPLPHEVPTLMIAGDDDAVSRHHNEAFGRPGWDSGLMHWAMFDDALSDHRGDSAGALLAGAGHYTPCWPLDETIGRTYLEAPDDSAAHRAAIASLITAFLCRHVLRTHGDECWQHTLDALQHRVIIRQR